MRFTLTIDCDNAAFEDDPSVEVARILADASRYVSAGYSSQPTRDSNGNTVGAWGFEGDES